MLGCAANDIDYDSSEYINGEQIIITAREPRFGVKMPFLDEPPAKLTCKRCSFETNSQDIFTAHKKNCPRI